MSSNKVVIIQRVLSHYRRPFYGLLRGLAQAKIELVLIYGSPTNSEVINKFACSILDKYYFAIPCIIF